MPTTYRKHPLSFAISMSLFAAVATSAVAAPPTNVLADDAQTAATQSAQSSGSSQQEENKLPRKSGAGKADDANTLSVVEVVGVRASQMRAIETKRMAADIQDSITAESI